MSFLLRGGGIDLPAPVSISVGYELIWSADTGRALDGYMIGEVIAEKMNVAIKWGMLTETQVALIKSALRAGFFSFEFRDCGQNQKIEVYRGTLSAEQRGELGDGIFWYNSATVDIIQR